MQDKCDCLCNSLTSLTDSPPECYFQSPPQPVSVQLVHNLNSFLQMAAGSLLCQGEKVFTGFKSRQCTETLKRVTACGSGPARPDLTPDLRDQETLKWAFPIISLNQGLFFLLGLECGLAYCVYPLVLYAQKQFLCVALILRDF